jgi:hypothetical protein
LRRDEEEDEAEDGFSDLEDRPFTRDEIKVKSKKVLEKRISEKKIQEMDNMVITPTAPRKPQQKVKRSKKAAK